MDETDVARIESVLGVTLPGNFRSFIKEGRTGDSIDDVTVMDDADAIIEATQAYREGFAGLKPWPNHLVYVGDESDASPYVIDCIGGKFLQLDKGNLERRPLKEYASFEDFRVYREREALEEVPAATQRLRGFLFFLPLVIGMLVIFIVLPGFAIAVKMFFEWLSN